MELTPADLIEFRRSVDDLTYAVLELVKELQGFDPIDIDTAIERVVKVSDGKHKMRDI